MSSKPRLPNTETDELVFDWGNTKIIFARLSNGVGVVWQKGTKTKSAALSDEDAERLRKWLEDGRRR